MLLIWAQLRVEWKRSFAFIAYGDDWRIKRRTFHQYFNQTAVRDYHSSMSKEAMKLVHRFLSTPEDFMMHIRTYVLPYNPHALLVLWADSK